MRTLSGERFALMTHDKCKPQFKPTSLAIQPQLQPHESCAWFGTQVQIDLDLESSCRQLTLSCFADNHVIGSRDISESGHLGAGHLQVGTSLGRDTSESGHL